VRRKKIEPLSILVPTLGLFLLMLIPGLGDIILIGFAKVHKLINPETSVITDLSNWFKKRIDLMVDTPSDMWKALQKILKI